MSREMSKDEIREHFLDRIIYLCDYWARVEDSKEDALEGLCYSIMSLIDGSSVVPICAFDLVTHTSLDDIDCREENDEDYVLPGVCINDNVMMRYEFLRILKEGKEEMILERINKGEDKNETK